MLTDEDIDFNALAKAVIAQAAEDLTTWNVKGKGNGAQCWHEVEEAKFLLTATDGDWLDSREIWCGLADLDPEKLRIEIEKVLKTGRVFRRHDFSFDETQGSGD